MKLFILLAATLVGCGGSWPTGEVCNQRNRLMFAGNIANSEATHCEGFDFDGDDVPAPYDGDDRYEDYGEDSFHGEWVGDIEECRDGTPNPLVYEDQQYRWGCITDYWFVQLDVLCTSWQSGDMSPFETNNLEIEAEAAEVYCAD